MILHKHIYIVLFTCICTVATAQQTEKVYLSGTGSDHTVQWDFYCTGGMNAGKWTSIAVPSCWELQGFGKYDYGFAKDSVRGKEQGIYRYQFMVQEEWKNKQVNIVFEGVMTDATVLINGKPAGRTHQGAFYAFKYDITRLLKWGKPNQLEVTVVKHSANASVNAAERKADYWIFGGIFRPVWLEVLPKDHIANIAINAQADGSIAVKGNIEGIADKIRYTVYDKNGEAVSSPVTGNITANVFTITGRCNNVLQWTPETPHCYTIRCELYSKGKLLHTVEKRFGFRSVTVKAGDGIYVNGVKVKMKGVNRHAFRPETGRTTNKQVSIEDVFLIKEMNMNAVRMSHYPPDDHFLDVCDSLGLFVMDELAGWHGHYDDTTGAKLVKEMMEHDAHHPSIIFWANGNEGGHNPFFDPLLKELDIQQRPVVHPWQLFGGFDTQHYREYNYGIGNYNNGNEIVMPTEFLHGQFDGGHGAGLEDYWEMMWHDPLSAGGFLWDFADNAVVRKDLNDSLDTDKHRAADGIMGPHQEKEGSFYTIKEVWSPVHFEKRVITASFDSSFTIQNRYHFTNTKQCSFQWELKRISLNEATAFKGIATAPDIAPGASGKLVLNLPADWNAYDILYITVTDPSGMELFTRSFPIATPQQMAERVMSRNGNNTITVTTQDSVIAVKVKDISIRFKQQNGTLVAVSNKKGELPLHNGPVVQEGVNNFSSVQYAFKDSALVITSAFDQKNHYNTLQWTVFPSGWVQLDVAYFPGAYFTSFAGINFSFPENNIRSVTYLGDGPYRVWKNRLKGNRFGTWNKMYNNTETGEAPWLYPEFKGYHSNFYGGNFYTRNGNRFTVATATSGLFLRLFTPAWKTDQWHNYEPIFPSGDVSFLNGISSIGTKTQRNETTGPMGMKNIYYDYEKDPARALHIRLYFNFSAE